MLKQLQYQLNDEQRNAAIDDPAIAVVDADLVLVVANHRFCALLGSTPAQVVGQPVSAFGASWFGQAIERLPFVSLDVTAPTARFLLTNEEGRTLALSCSTGYSVAGKTSYVLLATAREDASAHHPTDAEYIPLDRGLLDEHQELALSQEAANGLRNLLYMSISNRSLEQMLDYIYEQAQQLLAATGMAILWKPESSTVIRLPDRVVVLYAKGTGDAVFPALFDAEPLQRLLNGQQSEAVLLSTATGTNPQVGISRVAAPLMIDGQLHGVLLFDLTLPLLSRDTYRLVAWLGDQVVVAHCADELQQKAQRVVAHQERERLAREMHDAAMQSIYSLTLFAEAGRRFASLGKIDRVQDYLQQLSDTAKQALKELRLLLYELQPSVLEQVGLIEALQQRLESVERRTGMRVRLKVEDDLSFPAYIEDGLYRICQEALNNTLKHASASEVTISLSVKDGDAHLEICDDGIGFDSEDPNIIQSEGMTTMRERVRQMNARMFITSAPQQGACVHVLMSIPNAVD